jgi:hypothetical protein
VSQTLPIAFEENHGQAPTAYGYHFHRDGLDALFAAGRVDFLIGNSGKRTQTLRLEFVGTAAGPVATKPLSGHTNYFLGDDASRWVRNLPLFSRIEYNDLYPGISLGFYGNDSELEHDFTVAPGADPSRIVLSLGGSSGVTRMPGGDLRIDASQGALILRKPVAYQEADGRREDVPAEFQIAREGFIRFHIGRYDRSRPLIIDPVMVFATYLGGTGTDAITAVTADSAGNILVTGYTTSTDFPLEKPEQSAPQACVGSCQAVFITKIDPTGKTLIYSTYLGGSGLNDAGGAIVTDGSRNAIVAGVSTSNSFPHAGSVTSPTCEGNNECYFVASLTPDGSTLNYSGLIGGEQGIYTNGVNGDLTVDSAGNAYLAGVTDDPNFQITPGTLANSSTGYPYNNSFVLKVDPTGKLIYSTVIPENAASNPEQVFNNYFLPTGVAVDSQGEVTVVGWGGLGLPTTAGVIAQQFPNASVNVESPIAGTVLQLNSTASAINFASYLPGTDNTGGLAVDGSGNLWITGFTGETNLPVSANAYQKAPSSGSLSLSSPTSAYILEINATATKALGGTYVDGPGTGQQYESSSFTSIALDSSGNVFVGGMTESSDFPLQDPFVTEFEFTGSINDMILAEMSPDLTTVKFGSFLSSIDSSFGGSSFAGLAIDPSGHLIAAGMLSSRDFPTTPGTFEPSLPPPLNPLSKPQHSFIAKIDLSIPGASLCFDKLSVNFGNVDAKSSAQQTVHATNCGNAALSITAITSSDPTVTVSASCSSVALGATCPVTLTYEPINSFSNSGTITFIDNAVSIPQAISFTGQGLAPYIVPSNSPLSFGHLEVGTQGPSIGLTFSNRGQLPLTIGGVSVSGAPFSLVSQNCTQQSPVYLCIVQLAFAPTLVGAATGTLTVTSNDPATPQLAVTLTGVGDAYYGVPTITANSAPTVLINSGNVNVTLTGTNFYPQSTVQLNGNVLQTTFVDNGTVQAVIPGTALTSLGEQELVVVNPIPRGGTSASIPITPYQTVLINPAAVASVPATEMIYAAIPSSAPQNPNTVIPIDPTTGTAGTAIPVMTNPQFLAASSDGSFLFVAAGYNGTSAFTVDRINLKTGAVDRTFPFPPNPDCSTCSLLPATDLKTVPGQPTEVLLAQGDLLALYSDSGLVNYVPSGPNYSAEPQFDNLAVVSSTLTVYALPFTIFQNPFFNEAQITASGLTYTTLTGGNNGEPNNGSQVITDGTLLYTNNGQIWNPSTQTQIGSIPIDQIETPAITLDTTAGELYGAGSTSYSYSLEILLAAYGLNSQKLTGTVEFPQIYWPNTSSLVRWGADGMAFIEAGVGQTDQELYLLRTSIVTPRTANPTPIVQSIAPTAAVAGSAAFTLTVTGTGFISGSLVEWNGGPLNTTYVSATQVTASVPASAIATSGAMQVAVYNPAPGGGSSTTAQFTVVAPAPEASLSATTLAFGNVAETVASSAQSITLSNSGNSPLSLSGISASGDFSTTNTCGASLAVGLPCSISVVFTPTAVGQRTGTLTVNDNAGNSPQTIPLAGTGVAAVTIGTPAGGTTSATISSGGTATYNLSITGGPGFSGTVNLACSNAPQYATCAILPTSVQIAAGSTGNTAVTVNTTSTQTAFIQRLPVAFAGIALLPFFGLGWVSARRFRRACFGVFGLALAAAVLGIVSGCGGSGGGGGTKTVTQQTPAGTYTLTITAASGNVSATENLTLIVN